MNDRALALPGAEWVLRAMHDVATSMGRRVPLPIERELMLALQRSVLRTTIDVDALAVASPAALRDAITDPDLRAFVVRCAILVPYVSVEVVQAKVAALDGLALQLGIAPDLLRDLHGQRATQAARIARDQARRGARLLLTVQTTQPLRGVVDALARQRADVALAARYRSLADRAPSSLGRALLDLHRRHGVALPGERGCLDESLVQRDLLRILAGCAFDDDGEQELIGFVAGVERRTMGDRLVLDALAEIATVTHLSGALARDARPRLDRARFDAAFDAGVAASAALARDWPWWRDIGVDVNELRLRYGVRPPRVTKRSAWARAVASGTPRAAQVGWRRAARLAPRRSAGVAQLAGAAIAHGAPGAACVRAVATRFTRRRPASARTSATGRR